MDLSRAIHADLFGDHADNIRQLHAQALASPRYTGGDLAAYVSLAESVADTVMVVHFEQQLVSAVHAAYGISIPAADCPDRPFLVVINDDVATSWYRVEPVDEWPDWFGRS
jgi:hypothetical protein